MITGVIEGVAVGRRVLVGVGGGSGVSVGTNGVKVLLTPLMQITVPSGSVQHVGAGSACAFAAPSRGNQSSKNISTTMAKAMVARL